MNYAGPFLEPLLPPGISELEALRIEATFFREQVVALSKAEAMVYATITEFREGGKIAVLSFPEGEAEATIPQGTKGAKLGMSVRVLQKNRQIVGLVDTEMTGLVADVIEVLPNGFFVVDHGNNKRAIRPAGVVAEARDRVLMDARGKYAIKNIGRLKPARMGELAEVLDAREGEVEVKHDTRKSVLRPGDELGEVAKGDTVVMDAARQVALRVVRTAALLAVVTATGVEWDDVRGQDVAVRKLRAAIELPVQRPELFKAFRKKRVRGVCLHGTSGNGKTLLGRAAATAMARTYGKAGAETAYVYVKGPELKDRFHGGSEDRIRALFVGSRAHFAKHGYPQVIFLDEAESVLMSRQLRQSNSNVDVSMVQMMLAEMDGFEDTGAFFILATNRPQDIDPAILRKGRIDRKIFMPRPTRDKSIDILARHLQGRPLAGPEVSVARSIIQDLWSPTLPLYVIRCQDGKNDRRVTLADTVSGALLEGLVETAVEVAIDRCVEDETRLPVLTPLDFRTAIRELYRETYESGASETLQEFVAGLKDFRQVERIKIDFDNLPAFPDAAS